MGQRPKHSRLAAAGGTRTSRGLWVARSPVAACAARPAVSGTTDDDAVWDGRPRGSPRARRGGTRGRGGVTDGSPLSQGGASVSVMSSRRASHAAAQATPPPALVLPGLDLGVVPRLSAVDTVRARIGMAVDLGLLKPADRLPPIDSISRAMQVR